MSLVVQEMTTHTPSTAGDHEDLYLTLNVSRDASPEELKKSFRRLSQRYHPDKHQEEAAKETATEQFTKVKEAYEILSDDKLRRLYNEFGLDAARAAATQDMEMVPYSDLAERFRNDANAGAGMGGVNSPRDAYFTVMNAIEPQVDATGLVVALQDGDTLSSSAGAVFSQVGLSTMATAYVSQNNTVGARYGLKTESSRFGGRRRSGIGELAVSFRRQIDMYMHAEGTAYIPLDEGRTVNYGFKVFRSLSPDMNASFEATYDPERGDVTTALTSARSFDERCTASTSWAFGASPGYSFTWRRNAYDEYVSERKHAMSKEADEFGAGEDPEQRQPNRLEWVLTKVENFIEPMGWRWTARLNVMDASLGFVIRRPVGRAAPLFDKCEATGPGGASVKVRGQVGAMGWELEVGGGEKYIIADTAWGVSVAFGTVGVVWRFKVSRSGHRFTLPVVLVSSTGDAKVATAAALSTSLIVAAAQLFVVGPWRMRRETEEREEAKARRADVLAQGKNEAEAALALMRQAIERCREREESVEIDGVTGCGLLIERAVYGVSGCVKKMKYSDQLEGKELELEMADVTDSVQMLVEDSTVQIVSGTKSTLMGFWDPSAFGDKDDMLVRIWYRFKGELHECCIRDHEPIELPLSSHRVGFWA